MLPVAVLKAKPPAKLNRLELSSARTETAPVESLVVVVETIVGGAVAAGDLVDVVDGEGNLIGWGPYNPVRGRGCRRV